MTTFALVRTTRRLQPRQRFVPDRDVALELESFARAAGVHPELVRRLVRLGLLEPLTRPDGGMYFTRQQLAVLGRIERLHALADLNYSAIGLVLDLLDRIELLETALRRTSQPTGSDHGPEQTDAEVFRGAARRTGDRRQDGPHRGRR